LRNPRHLADAEFHAIERVERVEAAHDVDVVGLEWPVLGGGCDVVGWRT